LKKLKIKNRNKGEKIRIDISKTNSSIMNKDYYYYEESHHYDMPHIRDFSIYNLPTKQNKKEENHYAKLNLNLKKSPRCLPFEWISQNRKTSILFGALVFFVILALVGVAIASKRKRKKNL
jgi:hypothetical protein